MSNLETLGEHRCFGGVVSFHKHHSEACEATMRFAVYSPPQASVGPLPVPSLRPARPSPRRAVRSHKPHSEACEAPMRFAVYSPPQASVGPVPVLYYLAGLTSTEENFMTKAGAQRLASELGLMLVAPDTSPRGLDLPGEYDDYDLGSGAGFYIDATAEPWARHYETYSYVTEELCALVESNFPARADLRSIFGHSMGGHGALTIALKNPDRYRSVSAFAPISAPTRAPWGKKAFSNYLGPNEAAW